MLGLEILTVIVVAVSMALALAHALEWPGKLRLNEEQYRTVQPIYYPGFAIGGIAEPVGILLTLVLLVLTPMRETAFMMIAGAFAALLAMHAAYWLLTHPVNKFWLKDLELSRAGTQFFSRGTGDGRAAHEPAWHSLRDRWEFSHAVRAVLGGVGFTLLVTAVAL